MKLLGKYLKKYIVAIIAIVFFTFVMVQTELSLPDYMSSIVTGGIQYGGIEESFPKTITKEDMEVLKLFAFDDISNQYTLDNQNYKYIGEKDLSDELKEPLVYMYLINQEGIEVNRNNIDDVKASLKETILSLEDSYDNIVKLSIQKIYDNAGLDISKIQSSYILKAGLIMLGIAFLGGVAQCITMYLSSKIGAKAASEIRRDVFEKVESFSSTEFSKFSTASLITRTGNDVSKIQMLFQTLFGMMLMSPMMGITAIFKVIKYPNVSWILLVAVGVILGAMLIVLILAVPKFEIIQKHTDSINNIMREFLDGMLPIRAFNGQKREEDKFDETNKAMYKVDKFVSRIVYIMMPVMTFVMNGLTIAVIWISSKEINNAAMSVGEMMAYLQYAMHVVISFMMVSVSFFMIPRSMVSVKRINEVLNTEITIKDKEDAIDLPSGNNELIFENVSFKYPGAEENVLENISFSAKPKETVALIGSTGSGKSTIVKLIPRLFDVTTGKISYGGVDIRDIKQKDLRERIGYATQKAVLFSGDIESNIKFGRELSDEEINKAIDISQSRNIIEENEKGLKHEITQGGTNVSGGQKQRLAIARTLAKDKSLYIFDDTFSALDYQTDKKLRAELKELINKTEATVIIVAQRISTIKNADKIIVLDNGKIVGEGTHKELLKNCKVYEEIASSQLSKEELAHAA